MAEHTRGLRSPTWVTPAPTFSQGGRLNQLTRDHSLVQGLIDAEELTKEQGRTHPKRSLLTRALGMAPVVDPDISLPAVTGNARLLLCTDGLSAQADETQLASVLSTVADPDQAAAEFLRLANRNDGNDNTAVIIIDIPHTRKIPDRLATTASTRGSPQRRGDNG